jgi:hypothetical protein
MIIQPILSAPALFAALLAGHSVRVYAQTSEAPACEDSQRQNGIKIGAFRLLPELEANVSHDGNIYSSSSRSTADTIFRVTPRATLSSNTSRYRFNLSGGATVFHYARSSGENREDWNAAAQIQFEPLRQNFVGFRYLRARAHESRGDPNALATTTAPVPFDTAQGEITLVRDVGKLRADIALVRTDLGFDNALTLGGDTLNNKDRDRRQDRGSLRLRYKFSPGYSVFVSYLKDRIDYRLDLDDTGINRDSSGMRLTGGIYLSLTNLIDGEVFAGLQQRSYRDARLADYKSPVYGAALVWSANERTKVRLSGDRRLEETVFAGSKQYQLTTVELGVDRKFPSALSASVVLRYGENRYLAFDNSTSTASLDRNFGADLAVRKSIDRYVLGLTYTYSTRRTQRFAGQFGRNVVELSLATRF